LRSWDNWFDKYNNTPYDLKGGFGENKPEKGFLSFKTF